MIYIRLAVELVGLYLLAGFAAILLGSPMFFVLAKIGLALFLHYSPQMVVLVAAVYLKGKIDERL